MRTLVASPFQDDAASILEWAYGEVAGVEFYSCVSHFDQRPGQAFMNVLHEFDPEEYNRLSGSLVDPFYDDTKIPAALDKLTSKDMVPQVHRAYHTINNVLTRTTPCGCDKGENHWLPDGE